MSLAFCPRAVLASLPLAVAVGPGLVLTSQAEDESSGCSASLRGQHQLQGLKPQPKGPARALGPEATAREASTGPRA